MGTIVHLSEENNVQDQFEWWWRDLMARQRCLTIHILGDPSSSPSDEEYDDKHKNPMVREERLSIRIVGWEGAGSTK